MASGSGLKFTANSHSKLAEEMKKQGKAVAASAKLVPAILLHIAHDAGGWILDRAQTKYVPINSGALRDSGHIRIERYRGANRSLKFYIVFGNESVPYALAVHEIPDQSSDVHPPSWKGHFGPISFKVPGRGHKYLEKAVKDSLASGDLKLRAVEELRRLIVKMRYQPK